MMLVLLVATRPFQIMPLNALAAIVIAGVMPLVDFASLRPLLQVSSDLSQLSRSIHDFGTVSVCALYNDVQPFDVPV